MESLIEWDPRHRENYDPKTDLTAEQIKRALCLWAKCPFHFDRHRVFEDLVIAEPDLKLGLKGGGVMTWCSLDYKPYKPIRAWFDQADEHPFVSLLGFPHGRFEGICQSRWNCLPKGGLVIANFKTEKMGVRSAMCYVFSNGEQVKVHTNTLSVLSLQSSLLKVLVREMIRREIEPNSFIRSCEISQELSKRRILLCNFQNWLTSPEINIERAELLPNWVEWSEDIRKARATYRTFEGKLDTEIAAQRPHKMKAPTGGGPDPETQVENATATATTGSNEQPTVDLMALDAENPELDPQSVDWIASKKENEKKLKLSTDTLRKYRTDAQGGHTSNNKRFGIDRQGRFWRRKGTPKSQVYYLKSSLPKSVD